MFSHGLLCSRTVYFKAVRLAKNQRKHFDNLVKIRGFFGIPSGQAVQFCTNAGKSVGVTKGTETWEAVIGNQQRIMSKYLASWELWLASGGHRAISSLTETT